MFSPYVLQLVNNKDAREFFHGVPRNTKDRENAGRNKLVLLAVLSFLDGRSSCSPTHGDLKDRAGVSASSLKNALHALRRLDLLSVIHRPGLPSLIALGGHFEALFGAINDE
mgnify:CR=1 FL=1